MITFTLKNGTTIETTMQFNEFAFSRSVNSNSPYGFMETAESTKIISANGIIIKVPGSTTIKATPIKNADHELEITIGDGEAVITQPDGISSTFPKGTVLDGDGNIVN